MDNKILLTIFIIIFYIHFINGKDSIYNDMTCDGIPRYLTKDEVLKIKNAFFIAFYCKDNLYIKTDNSYMENFVEFPDENGRTKKYISDTHPSDEFESGRCITTRFVICTSNSECLSDKCFNSFCVFNDENSIVHCNSIYRGGRRSYMYCDKWGKHS